MVHSKSRFILLISFLFVSSLAVCSDAQIQALMRDQTRLMSSIGMVNGFIRQLPGQVTGFIPDNAVILARVSGSQVTIVVRNKQIQSIYVGQVSKPDYYLDTHYDVVCGIADSEHPANTIFYYLLNGKISLRKAESCSTDLQCADNQVCEQGYCKNAFTIVVVPLDYASNEYWDFYRKSKWEMDYMLSTMKFPAKRVRIHYVDPKVCPNYECSDACSDCQSKALDCARKAGLASVADRVIAGHKGDLAAHAGGRVIPVCGCAGGIPSRTSVAQNHKQVGQYYYCVTSMPHELGHSLGLYHVNSMGNEGGACQGPNAADCNDARKNSDIMGYKHPRDHYGPAAYSYLQNLLARFSG